MNNGNHKHMNNNEIEYNDIARIFYIYITTIKKIIKTLTALSGSSGSLPTATK